jgi:hypothetical protein
MQPPLRPMDSRPAANEIPRDAASAVAAGRGAQADNDVNVLRNIIISRAGATAVLRKRVNALGCPAAGAAEHQIPLPRKEARTNRVNTKRPRPPSPVPARS